MKTITYTFLISLLVFGCKVGGNDTVETPNAPIANNAANENFADLNEYQIVSDTLIYMDNFHPQFALQELRKGGKTVIVFSKILDAEDNFSSEKISTERRQILDTLHINNVLDSEIILTGCCTETEKYAEEIIAVIKKTHNLLAENISQAWRANLETGKIEKIYDLTTVECINKNHKVEITEEGF